MATIGDFVIFLAFFNKLVDENERLSLLNKELKQKNESMDNENFVLIYKIV